MFWEKYGQLKKIFYNPQCWHNIFFIVNFYISFTLLLIIWGEVIWALVVFRSASFLTFHYSIYFGVDWLGGIYNFLIFSGLAAAIFCVNFILANILFNRKKILSYFLSGSVSLILLFMLVIVTLIAYINWSNPGA